MNGHSGSFQSFLIFQVNASTHFLVNTSLCNNFYLSAKFEKWDGRVTDTMHLSAKKHCQTHLPTSCTHGHPHKDCRRAFSPHTLDDCQYYRSVLFGPLSNKTTSNFNVLLPDDQWNWRPVHCYIFTIVVHSVPSSFFHSK